ncbi:MAG: TrkA family potassium uptake protein [Candidatus Delongbacteria bacterium]|nr:TrkA family potassium uptake protein [Candidatus Delongbacteria bacterium]
MSESNGKFCVIGLGKFGFNVASNLYQNGNEVIAIDLNKDKVQKIADECTVPIVGDASDKQFLLSHGVSEVDAVFVSAGDNSDMTTLITLLLREIGVKRIFAKTNSEEHKRILGKVGATDIIFPEKDIAVKLAVSLSYKNISEYIPLSKDFSISEIIVHPNIIGKNLMELDLRKKFHINIVAIKNPEKDKFSITVDPNYRIKKDDILIVVGKNVDIATFSSINY